MHLYCFISSNIVSRVFVVWFNFLIYRCDCCNGQQLTNYSLGLLTVHAATVQVEFCCSFDFWLEVPNLIKLHLPWWICIGFYSRNTLHKNFVWLCLNACLLILLTIALVLLWCLVDQLGDLLLMVTLLFLVIGLTGVWDLLLWLTLAAGMFCLLVWDRSLID